MTCEKDLKEKSNHQQSNGKKEERNNCNLPLNFVGDFVHSGPSKGGMEKGKETKPLGSSPSHKSGAIYNI